MKLSHQSAKASHYNKESKTYDLFNDELTESTNKVIETFLKEHSVKKLLDLSCGTGAQVFYFASRGYEVVGSDISTSMLNVAKAKAKKEKISVKLIKGDMRTSELGTFDAVLTIFNAVGHLTKSDFEQTMLNINKNVKVGGLYIFDIFNLNFFLSDDQITQLTIDWQKTEGECRERLFQYSTITHDGILASHTTHFTQQGTGTEIVKKSAQTLQIYRAAELEEMLVRTGFKVLDSCGIDGLKFDDLKSDNILMVAQKSYNK